MDKPRETWHGKEIYGELDISIEIKAFWKGEQKRPWRRTYNTIPGTASLPPGHYALIKISDETQR